MDKLITIITVVYNEVDKIEMTVLSVLKYKTPPVEYIVIDAVSNDGTFEILLNYKDQIDVLISEKDNGIYNAMNKGIANSSGRYLLFLNAGDILLNLPSYDILKIDYELMCFPVKVNNHRIRMPYLDWRIKLKNTLPHQGIFYKKSNFLQFDEQLAIFSDYDLNIRYYKSKDFKIICLHQPIIANHNLDGVSNNRSAKGEFFWVIQKNFGMFWVVLSHLSGRL